MSNGFLGQDWSWANLKGKGQGILSDPQTLMDNPWFRMGMGVLSENQQPYGGDPFGAVTGTMSTIKKEKQEDEDRKRIQELREQIADIIRQQQLGRRTVYGGPGNTQPMSPVPQQGPASIMDMYRRN